MEGRVEGGGRKNVRISVDSTRRADIDNDSVFSILHAEVRRRGSNKLERRRVVNG